MLPHCLVSTTSNDGWKLPDECAHGPVQDSNRYASFDDCSLMYRVRTGVKEDIVSGTGSLAYPHRRKLGPTVLCTGQDIRVRHGGLRMTCRISHEPSKSAVGVQNFRSRAGLTDKGRTATDLEYRRDDIPFQYFLYTSSISSRR
jgi:hypothetical protein